MSRTAARALLITVALSAAGVSAPVASAPQAAQVVTCTLPVGPKDTYASLRKRFGSAAVQSKLDGPEGEELNGVVLWPNDPARRLELILTDDGARTVSDVRITGKSRWSAGGLRLGDSLLKVQQLNGKPFKMSGFGWDYGGYVNDLDGGKLDKLPGGCNLSIRMEPSPMDDYPNGIEGDVSLSSTNPKLRAAKPVVYELTVGW